ncbi:MAG: hypothetical protein JWM57_2997, partial [Phycisphaerales bacterium]|nr:hypothetical protein [Phycisphaerales bacterium]
YFGSEKLAAEFMRTFASMVLRVPQLDILESVVPEKLRAVPDHHSEAPAEAHAFERAAPDLS